jgi:formate--tetrahydrofolate ligase
MATTTALRLADYTVTEAGFGADLGAEKFFDIKCRKAGLRPDVAVLVATVRALKMHGGVARDALGAEDVAAVERGLANLQRHVENVRRFGVPVVVAVNRFGADTEAELAAVCQGAARLGAPAHVATHWAEGGRGTEALAREVVALAESGVADFRPLYADDLPLWEKIRTVATTLYAAADVTADRDVREQIDRLEGRAGRSPICIAKTQYSFSTDPTAVGAPSGHTLHVREVRFSAGADMVVVLAGDIMTMPGLPKKPAAMGMGLDADGRIVGLS